MVLYFSSAIGQNSLSTTELTCSTRHFPSLTVSVKTMYGTSFFVLLRRSHECKSAIWAVHGAFG